jgi:serine/threonine protein kinase
MLCPSCKVPNESAAENCASCGGSLAGLAPGRVVAERYEIVRPLGKGGMGMVFEARDTVLDETVALKVLRTDVVSTPELARRFRQEIKLARKVRHKNVCGIHEYGEDGALHFIAMDLVDGTDLRQQVQRRGPLPPRQACEVALQIAQGLEAIHDEGIVHRDMKTANIMIDRSGSVRLMDFGIAKATQESGTGLTATGMIVGTPEYMSPEQARGAPSDPRSDIYALGIILFEILTGDVPFRGDTPISTILKQLQEPPLLQVEPIPPVLRPILARALEKDPVARYSTARDVICALNEAMAVLEMDQDPTLDGMPPVSEAASPARSPLAAPTPAPRPTRRSPALVWTIAVAAVLLLVTLVGIEVGSRLLLSPRVSPTLAPSKPTAEPSRSGPSAPPESLPAGATLSAPDGGSAVEAGGSLRVVAVPWADVTVDGHAVEVGPMRRIPLTAGPHVIRVLHPDYQPLQRKVTIKPGETFTLSIDLVEDAVPVKR